MPLCPMCQKTVAELKKNCHVLPRAFAKRTKDKNGKNILLDFSNHKIAVNQADYKDNFWCAACEKKSALDDSYGAAVLIHGTEGKLTNTRGIRVSFKWLSDLDYEKFKKFIVSVVIRDHLARTLNSQDALFDSTIFERLRDVYNGVSDDIAIVGYYLVDSDPISKAVHPPTLSKKGDGVNFQLFNFNFMVYFDKSQPNISAICLSGAGKMPLVERDHQQTGNHGDLDKNYLKIIEDEKNRPQLDKIKKKYP